MEKEVNENGEELRLAYVIEDVEENDIIYVYTNETDDENIIVDRLNIMFISNSELKKLLKLVEKDENIRVHTHVIYQKTIER